jgi:hypothetical protein
MPPADVLCERLDARQAQGCGSGASGGSGPRRSQAAPYGIAPAVRSRGEYPGALLSARQCGMPLCRTTLCHPGATIACPDGRPFSSRVLSRQPSRTLHCTAMHIASARFRSPLARWCRTCEGLAPRIAAPTRPRISGSAFVPPLSHPGSVPEPLFFNLGLNVRSEFRTPS